MKSKYITSCCIGKTTRWRSHFSAEQGVMFQKNECTKKYGDVISTMFLFTIIAKPKPDNLNHKESGGAFVNAYIDFKEEEGAEVLARYFIEDSGWFIEETDEVSFLIEADLEKDSEQHEYFLEAKENGSCLVFNTWPIDDEALETKH